MTKITHVTQLIDPLKKYTNISNYAIFESLGFLPGWVINSDYYDKSLKEALDDQYCCGLFEMTGGTVDENGVFSYPEDPDMYPLIKMQRGDETFYQYQSGIIAIVQKDGSTFMTRMD